MELAVLVVLTIVLVLAVVRLLLVRDIGSQAMILEFGFMTFIALLVTLGSALRTGVLFDLLLVASVVGFLFTIGLARLQTRGRR
ncbi:monovalent cation/H+ antiporter complex subunit F [Dietzia lutea]|uniref:Pesticidal protein Cry26Aa n=1 Tax=Dietzia lutea TaxID=546160 RepID=A0A2S1R9N7_9ACTN|nr:monovalent cation/H+ antiporter complex subunit F [Dietzia lutea]AWH93008.1 hypothetical protein A6035_13440 [Dietzia lutea]